MIQFLDVSKKFNNKTVISNVSFHIPKGRITALIGANGSGKTTTMRMISTVFLPDSGKILVNNWDTQQNVREVRKQIGLMLGGDAALFQRFTARENISYFGALQGLSRAESAKRTEELCHLLKMDAYIDQKVDHFSRGMRQKVLLAETLIHDPSLLLLDEPSTGLDIFSALEVQNIILKCREMKKSVLISSHNMSEIERLCDYIIILHQGKALYSGDSKELLETSRKTNITDAFVSLTQEVN